MGYYGGHQTWHHPKLRCYNLIVLRQTRTPKLWIGILLAIVGIVLLAPQIGATGNGERTPIYLIASLLRGDSACFHNPYPDETFACDGSIDLGQWVGFIFCLLFGLLFFICAFRLLWAWHHKAWIQRRNQCP